MDVRKNYFLGIYSPERSGRGHSSGRGRGRGDGRGRGAFAARPLHPLKKLAPGVPHLKKYQTFWTFSHVWTFSGVFE